MFTTWSSVKAEHLGGRATSGHVVMWSCVYVVVSVCVFFFEAMYPHCVYSEVYTLKVAMFTSTLLSPVTTFTRL